ncbi:hypothetical protein PQR62_05480 [Herbaspirillum lusitanum]|uniref:Uncharacterized protein n=1 Tax=Herbaspirillum lusitanum TaxID=213312 RepID=A0ABW9A6X8_9BURK
MKKRGKVVRDTQAGSGLISINGEQFPFELEGMWKSDVAPRVNMVVDVGFDAGGGVETVQVVPEGQLAREQAEGAVREAKLRSQALGRELAGRFGIGTLAGIAALVCGWFLLNTIDVRITSSYSNGLSFWKLLGALNSPADIAQALSGSGSGAGIYGFFAIVALCGPMLPFFLRHRLAWLGNLAPLAFMVLVCIIGYSSLSSSMHQAQGMAAAFGGAQAAAMAAEVASSMMREVLRAVSLGLGAYLSLIAGLYFAGRGAIQFLSSRA